MLYDKVTETIGNTPLIRCHNLERHLNLKNQLYVKVESFNPGGSVKDRAAFRMLSEALNKGDINSDTLIIEPTSGNTGIGLAMVCASLNLSCMIVIPDSMSVERRKLIKAYGGQLILTPGNQGMSGAIEKANLLHGEIVNSFIPSQFDNPNNPLAHYVTTGIEIVEDLNDLDIFIAGIGTGGTISGVGRYLKKHNSQIEVIGVEPSDSPFISQGKKGPHKIQGIGAGFIPSNYNPEVVDDVVWVGYQDSLKHANLLAKKEGILAGISSGAALAAAIEIAEDCQDKKIVVLLPDTGERYLSTELFNEE